MAINYEAIFGQDDYDPCEALRALRPVYMQLLTGQTEQKITFRDRDTWFFKADLPALQAMISQLESDCAAKNGTQRRRFAITVGARYARG